MRLPWPFGPTRMAVSRRRAASESDRSPGQEPRPPGPAIEYRGMTVNERLVLSGSLDAWDSAVSLGDRSRMIAVLRATGLTEEQAAGTSDAVLADRRRYGLVPGNGTGPAAGD